MSNALSLYVSQSAAAAHWGKDALLSFNDVAATIHINDSLDNSLDRIQRAGRSLDNQGIREIELAGDNWTLESAWFFYQGYYNAKDHNYLNTQKLSPEDQQLFAARKLALDWTRETINLGPEKIFPESLCQSALELLESLAPGSIHHQLIVGEELLEQGWVGTYQVGRGSVNPPAMLQLDYNPTGSVNAAVDIALVGKGITFDSGGYSLKQSDGMSVMKSDMGGAATMVGALALAIINGSKQRIRLILCCAENLVSGHAYKLGDVLEYKNDKTVEILNTDAEGRLVLADGLIAANEAEAKIIIDAATLTGAAKFALGRDYNALLGFDQALVQQAMQAAKSVNERVWPLPLEDFHMTQLPSAFADLANVHAGEGKAGASTAAGFLAHFLEQPKQGWLHLDLAGSYQKSADALWATGGKGHGVRTIAALIEQFEAAE